MAPAKSDPDHVYLLADAKQKSRIREILAERGLVPKAIVSIGLSETSCRGRRSLETP